MKNEALNQNERGESIDSFIRNEQDCSTVTKETVPGQKVTDIGRRMGALNDAISSINSQEGGRPGTPVQPHKRKNIAQPETRVPRHQPERQPQRGLDVPTPKTDKEEEESTPNLYTETNDDESLQEINQQIKDIKQKKLDYFGEDAKAQEVRLKRGTAQTRSTKKPLQRISNRIGQGSPPQAQ